MLIKIKAFGSTWVDDDVPALVLLATVVAIVGLFVLNLRLFGRYFFSPIRRARVSYTIPAPVGKITGRSVDAELWSRLVTAFVASPFNDHSRLEDLDDPQEIEVANARLMADAPTLSSHGFELRVSPSEVEDWERTDEVAQILRREAERIVLEATGASGAHAFDHTWISSRRSNLDSSLGPGGRSANLSSSVSRVHTDTYASSGRDKINELVANHVLPPHAADTKQYRAAILNVWRAYGTGPCVKAAPLGCVDPSSVDPSSTFPYTLATDALAGVNGSIAFDPGHRWYYFDAMTAEEVLVFTNFEEPEPAPAPPAGEEGADGGALLASGRPRGVYHAALEMLTDDGRPENDATERTSVEVRVVALFPCGSR